MRHDWVRAPAVSIPRPTGGVYLVEVIGAGELEVRGAVGLGFSARRYLAPAEAGPHAAGRHVAARLSRLVVCARVRAEGDRCLETWIRSRDC